MASHQLCVLSQVSEIPRLVDWAKACCGADGVADDTAFKIALALEEAVINVIGHAFADLPPPHLIRVRLEITAERLSAEVLDNGHPFDPTAAPSPDLSLPLERRHPGGLGIHLMRTMMDRIHYRRSDGNNVLRMEKARR